MNLALAFWAPWDATDAEAVENVTRQAREWAEVEPNVLAYEVVSITRPYADRHRWYQVDVALAMREQEREQTTWLV